eukprot:TRINITY_DN15110_c2_g1_i1.p1 TRINITY_DN15110_c2_g1~~TRINITY_DN15110_c2_g1_i1.p1  ORF type:complete len:1657 (+),score=326.61 TRINITY_DN15110_c2_g1_i1:76-4971(+)
MDDTEGGGPRPFQRPKLLVPAKLLLGLAALLSVLACAAGGVFMYLEALRVLEEQVDETSKKDVEVAQRELNLTFREALVTSGEQKVLMDLWNFSSFTEMQQVIERQQWARMGNSDLLYSMGVRAVPLKNITTNPNAMVQMVWWDPLTEPSAIMMNNGSLKQWVNGVYLPENWNHSGCLSPESDPPLTGHCVESKSLDPDTGQPQEVLYYWTDSAMLGLQEADTEYPDKRRRVEQQQGWQEKGATYWRSASIWYSADGTPYVYSAHVRIPPSILGVRNPLLKDYKIALYSYVSFYGWQTVLYSLTGGRSHTTTIACFINNGLDSQVLATSETKILVQRGCAERRSGAGDLKADPCLRVVRELRPTIQDMHTLLTTASDDQFLRARVRGGEHWMRRKVVFRKGPLDLLEDVHVMWMRSTSSVQDKVNRGLYIYIFFVIGVFTLQACSLAVQWLQIGSPLASLARAMGLIDHLDLDGAEARIRKVVATVLGVTEIYRVVLSFRTAVLALRQYRSYLPAALITATAEGAAAEAALKGQHTTGFGSRVVVPVNRDTQVLPQLRSAKIRAALQCAVAQTSGMARDEIAALLTERIRACNAEGDVSSARALLHSGWEAPTSLRDELAPLHPPHPPHPPRPPDDGPCADLNLGHGDAVPRRKSTRLSEFSDFAGSDTSLVAEVGRFGDGAADPGTAIATAPLYPAEYVPPEARKAVLGLSRWHCPKGDVIWPRKVVEDMMSDFHVCLPQDSDAYAALYCYTAEFHRPVLWAVWRNNAWQRLDDHDSYCSPDFTTVKLDRDVFMCQGVDVRGTGEVYLMGETRAGLRAYRLEGRAHLLRYENAQGGDSELSPIRDIVLWAPSPDALMAPKGDFSIMDPSAYPVPPGVYEFITSRSFTVHLVRENWSSTPAEHKGLARLRESCLARRNQQRPVEKLSQAARQAFVIEPQELTGLGLDPEHLAAAVLAAFHAKCPAGNPTPGQIANATELNVLQWHGRWQLVALTGAPRVTVVPTASVHLRESAEAQQLYRLDDPYDEQPYFLMNASMRHMQNSRLHAELDLRPHFPDPFVARQPETVQAPEPAAAVFSCGRIGYSARWDGGWLVSGTTGTKPEMHEGELRVQAWGLPQYRALIWWIEDALRGLPLDVPADGGLRKGYRGIVGVALDRKVYSRGSVVVFGSFTSSSSNQGVAVGFASAGSSEGGASIFTMFGMTGRNVSRYSRYGREKEVLYPPNTVHLVTESLSAEHAAILNKSKVQVFDLRELSVASAVSHLAKEGALETCREHPGVLRQAERVAARAESGDWVGVARELVAAPQTSAAERQFTIPVIPKDTVGIVALAFNSAAGTEVGAGIDTALWNGVFECAESAAKKHGAHLIATHVGKMLLQVCRNSDGDAAEAAIALASELLSGGDSPTPQGSPAAAALSPSRSLGSPAGPQVGLLHRRASAYMLASPRQAGSPDEKRRAAAELRLYCGVSVGRVHSGFAGSSVQRVEIADGPAVRRARRMAKYALCFGVLEIVTDTSCATVAPKVGMIAWTVDIVSFDDQDEVREPISCIAKRDSSSLASQAAARLQDAWTTVMSIGSIVETAVECDALRARDALNRLQGDASLQAIQHRSARALMDAVDMPSVYCCTQYGAAS